MNNKQKLGYMAIGAGGPVVEASYEIAEYYEATTGYIPVNDFDEPTMQIWTIRFDKPPQVLRVRNAVEYTLLDTELHIVARCSDLIIVLWDGGKKIFGCPFHQKDRFAAPAIAYNYSDDFSRRENPIIRFTGRRTFQKVGIKEVTIRGVSATEIESDPQGRSQWKADVELPANWDRVTVTWTLTNGIRGSRKIRLDN